MKPAYPYIDPADGHITYPANVMPDDLDDDGPAVTRPVRSLKRGDRIWVSDSWETVQRVLKPPMELRYSDTNDDQPATEYRTIETNYDDHTVAITDRLMTYPCPPPAPDRATA